MLNNGTGTEWSERHPRGHWTAADFDERERLLTEVRNPAFQIGAYCGRRLDPLLRWWEDTRSNLIRGWHRGRAARKHGN